MKKAKMTAKQKQEQAAKQKKMELTIIAIVAAVLIVATILIVIFVGAGEKTAHVHDDSCTHDTEPVQTTAHEHDENCDHGTEVTAPPVTRDNGGDGATLETAQATHYVTIELENFGTLKGELYGNTAPISVNNFVNLASSGFYEGLTFHRILEGFMMQGGAPNADSPSVEPIQGEFAANGIENNLLHKAGVLSMARTNVMDSATSQFFIMHEDYPSLDGQYAAFGRITEGLDIVDKICTEVAGSPAQNGAVDADNQPVIKSITVTAA